MNREQSFLKAIADSPDDVELRLVYCDWLEDHGQSERAEFIRAECEMASIRDGPVGPNRWESPRFWELHERAGDLYDAHRREWFGPLLDVLSSGEMTTRLGFPWHIAMSARTFIDKGEAIFRAAPTIEDVILDRLGQNMPKLAQCPALAHVSRLSFFETPVRAREVVQFAESPYLENLKRLDLAFTDTHIGPGGAVALASAKSLRRLEDLDLYQKAIFNEGAEALLEAERFASLTRLNLGNNGLTEETAWALAAADHLELRDLDLGSNYLMGESVSAIAEASHLERLECLALNDNPLGEDPEGESGPYSARCLVDSVFSGGLRKLDLSSCSLDDEAVSILLDGDWPRLAELRLGSNRFVEQSARALTGNKSLAGLEKLTLPYCEVTPEVAGILGSIRLPVLKELDLSHNPIHTEGIRALLEGSLVHSVSHLELASTNLTNAGVEVLANSPTMRNVRWLELEDNRITDKGARALAGSPHLEDIGCLDLTRNKIGTKAKLALAARFGDRVELD